MNKTMKQQNKVRFIKKVSNKKNYKKQKAR